MKKFLSFFLIFVLVLLILMIIFEPSLYIINRKPSLTTEHKRVLLNLTREAIKNEESPVGAVLIYDYTIIGSGHNSVYEDANISSHAEINAINDVIKQIGYREFMALNRDSLIIITTDEPCQMCKGAFQEYNIKYVHFLKGHPFSKSLKVLFGDLIYNIRKKQLDSPELRDSLSKLHPYY